MQPLGKFIPERWLHQRIHPRQRNHQHGKAHHDGRIHSCKTPDKQFCGRFPLASFLHEVQDARYGTFAGRTHSLEPHDALAGNHARQHLLACLNDARHAFACQCRGVKCRRLARQPSVDRHAFTWLHFYDITHLDVGRGDCFPLVSLDNHRMVGSEGYQRLDVTASAAHSTILQHLADAVQCHHRHRLGILPDGKCTNAGDTHQ